MSKKVWVQTAIDVEDMDLAKRIAWMALDAGAEWLEIGTPLLYKYGYKAISDIRKAVGKNAILVADYKFPYAKLIAENAANAGADFVMLQAAYDDDLVLSGISECKKAGIKPIFDLHINSRDVTERTKQLEDLGVEYLFSHQYAKQRNSNGVTQTYNTLQQIQEANTNVKIGITSDNLDEAVDSVRCGADWITFGMVLRKPDVESCRKWIDSIHNAR